MLIASGLVSVCLALYNESAYAVARYAFDDGSKLGRLYTPCGALLPWPKAPGMATALSKGNAIDLFIYRYLIESWILVGINVICGPLLVLIFCKGCVCMHACLMCPLICHILKKTK